MARHGNLSHRFIVSILVLYSICQVMQVAESRFLWDLSLYCIQYCSRLGIQSHPIGVCSCHRITSYHRRGLIDDLPTFPDSLVEKTSENDLITENHF